MAVRPPARLLLPAALLQLDPLAHLRPLAVLDGDEATDAAHHAAIVAAIAVLEAPARVPVLDGLDRLEQRFAGEVPPRALQGLDEQRRLLIAVEVGGVQREAREVLLH